MTAAELLGKLPQAFNAQAADGMECVIQFNVSTPMYALIREGSCIIEPGVSPSSDIAVTMTDEDLVAMMRRELNGMTAFMTGRLQVDGDLILAQRLTTLFDASKLR